MELDNFKLGLYNKYNVTHSCVMEDVFDLRGTKYLSSYDNFLRFFSKCSEDTGYVNVLYIAVYNDRPVGFISLVHKDFGYEVISGMLPRERGQRLGALLLQEFSEKIFEKYDSIDKLFLKIDEKNLSAIKTALLVGFKRLNGETYVMERVPVSKKSR